MNQNRKWLQQIVGRFLAGKSTEKEGEFLEGYDRLYQSQAAEPDTFSYEEQARLEEKMEQNIMAIIGKKEHKTVRMWPRTAAAIAACGVLLVGGYLLLHSRTTASLRQPVAAAAKIQPGSDKAILTLADGSQISLTQQKNGQIAAQNGVSIVNVTNGLVSYAGKNNKPNVAAATAINTVSTPGGGQYQIVLPYGTKVWLNAVSSLSFPVSFGGSTAREVSLKGEAYFEVSKDEQHPFIVKTITQEVRVLGTHFNVNAYTDESATITTLLEGSVKVSGSDGTASAVLTPDQQTSCNGGKIDVREVIGEDAIAWKEGYFRFNNEPLEEVLKKISRWYNVSIVYKDEEIKKKAAYGTMSRFSDISEVIRLLELTRTARFEIQNNEVIVSK
ncbi:MAG TPA: FecR domain-containing protein [Puia sp.]|nr:FecR domain-containing protein [Puia sp.]